MRLRSFGALGCLLVLVALLYGSWTPAQARLPAEQQGEQLEHGDAPDSTNHAGVMMQAYASVPARFPTVFNPGTGLPEGPSHINHSIAFLGDQVTTDFEADLGFDADGLNNIDPALDAPDRDRADDAFYLGTPQMTDFIHCQAIKLDYRITAPASPPSKMYVNIWIDWDASGFWGMIHPCQGQLLAPEWAVQNQIVTLTGPGVYNLQTPGIIGWFDPATGPKPAWLRITLSETPATNDDGRGPANRWQLGETEDYLIPVKGHPDPSPTPHTDKTPTPTPRIDPTATPHTDPTSTPTPQTEPTRTPTPTPRIDPTATPHTDPTSTPTPQTEPTRTPTPTPHIDPTSTPQTDPTKTPTPQTEPTRTPTPTPQTEPTKTPTPQTDPTKTPTPQTEPTRTPTPTPHTDPTSTPTVPPQGERFDLGDAPDGTNSTTSGMSTYFPAIPARFPTVYGVAAPHGPLHRDIRPFFLGNAVTGETEADAIFDSDGVFNLVPPQNVADQDRADDGLLYPTTMAGYPHCAQTNLRVRLTNTTAMPRQVYLNAWFDWNRNAAWGGFFDCPQTLAREWGVQNQVITLPANSSNIYASVPFIAAHPRNQGAFWLRVTVSDTPATNDDGRGIPGGWRFGETEDYVLWPDLGDAPDSNNSQLRPIPAYTWPTIFGRFPTVYNRIPATLPRGPLHHNLGLRFHLGRAISSEHEADQGPDADAPNNNLNLALARPDLDRADDAFPVGPPSTWSLGHCQLRTLTYNVTVPSSPPGGTAQAYVNVWIDWRRNGSWGDLMLCPGWSLVNEWAVQNQPLTLSGPGTYTFTTPAFRTFQPNGPRPAWMRITISDTPVPAALTSNGSGPVSGWNHGETEDYLLRPKLIVGTIGGTISLPAGTPAPGVRLHLLAEATGEDGSQTLSLVESIHSDLTGAFTFTDVMTGSYTIMGQDPSGSIDPLSGILISDETMHQTGLGLSLIPNGPPPPQVQVSGPGSIQYDADGSPFTLVLPGQATAPNAPIILTIPPALAFACDPGSPTNTQIELRHPITGAVLLTLPATFDPVSGTYSVTISPGDLNTIFATGLREIAVYATWLCGSTTHEAFLGLIMILDPSGVITDRMTGEPIVGAEVRLFYTPGWISRRNADDALAANTCESNESKPLGAPWSQPAPTAEGIQADPLLVLMAPSGPVQITGSDGRYAWDVQDGCWYVTVKAQGYATLVSPVVGVPSAVTDLDLELLRADFQLFLPAVTR